MEWSKVLDHAITAAMLLIPAYFAWRVTMRRIEAAKQVAGAALQASNENAVDIAKNTQITEATQESVVTASKTASEIKEALKK